MGHRFMKQLQPLASETGDIAAESREIPAGPRQALDEPALDRIDLDHHHNRDDLGCLPCGESRLRAGRQDDVNVARGQVRGKLRKQFAVPDSGTVFDDDVTTLVISEYA